MRRWISTVFKLGHSFGRVTRHRLTVFLSVIGLLALNLSSVGVLPQADAAPDPNSNLYNYLTLFELRDPSPTCDPVGNPDCDLIFSIDSAGNTTGTPTVVSGQRYAINMSFADHLDGDTFAPDGTTGVLTYQIPDGVTVLDDTAYHPITDKDGATVASFIIQNGIITVTPDPSYTTEGTPANAFWSDANAEFTIRAYGEFYYQGTDDTHELHLDFGSEITPDIDVEPPDHAGLTVTKYSTAPYFGTENYDIIDIFNEYADLVPYSNYNVNRSYNPATHVQDFVAIVTIDPTGGPVVLSDLDDEYSSTPANTFSYIDDSLVLVYVPVSGSGDSSVVPAADYTVDTSHDGQISVVFTDGNLAVGPGDRLFIDYKMHVNDDYLESVFAGGATQYALGIDNTMTADGQDKAGHMLTDWGEAKNTVINGTIISKTASTTPPDGYSAWTATVGDGYYPLIDFTITDSLQGGAYTNIQPNDFCVAVSGMINDTLTKLGTECYAPGTSTPTAWTPVGGLGVGGTDNASIDWGSGGDTFTYHPATQLTVNGQAAAITQASFTYYSTAASVTGTNPGGKSTNTIEANGHGGNDHFDVSDTGTSSSSNWDIAKSGTLNTDAIGAYMEYTIKAKIPSVFYGQPLNLTDSFWDNGTTLSPMYYSDNSGGDSQGTLPNIDLGQLLNQDALSVSVFGLTGDNADKAAKDLDPSTLADDQISSFLFDTTPPSVNYSPSALGDRVPDDAMTARGSWNIMATGWAPNGCSNPAPVASCYTDNTWTMTFGQTPGTAMPARWDSDSSTYDTSGSIWPVDQDGLLVVTYRVYLSTPVFNNSNKSWTSGLGYYDDTITNTATLHSDGQAKAAQYNIFGLIRKYGRTSWAYSYDRNNGDGTTTRIALPTAPKSLGTLGQLLPGPYDSMEYITYPSPLDGENHFYFPFFVSYRYPYLTDLSAPPILSDKFDSHLIMNTADSNTYVFLTVYYAAYRATNNAYTNVLGPTYTMLIQVPLTDITFDNDAHTFSVNLADIADVPTLLEKQPPLISLAGAPIPPVSFGEDAQEIGSFSSPQAAYDYLRYTELADPSFYNQDLVGTMPDDWWNLNYKSGANPSYGSDPSTPTSVAYPTTYGQGYYDLDYLLTFPDNTIPDDLRTGTNLLSNTATMQFSTSDEGSGRVSSKLSFYFATQSVGKNMPLTGSDFNNGNTVDVNVNLNPYAMDITGSDTADNVYQAIDKMIGLIFKDDSLVVYPIPTPMGKDDDFVNGGNGGGHIISAPTNYPNYTSLPPQPMTLLTYAQMEQIQNALTDKMPIPAQFAYSYYVDSANDFGGQSSDAGNIYLYLPDGHQFEIDYQAIVDTDSDSSTQTVSFTNAISLTGQGYNVTSQKNGITILDASGSGSSSRQSVTLTKLDSFSMQPLADGVFALYAPQSRKTPDTPPSTITLGNGDEYAVTTNAGEMSYDQATKTMNIPLTLEIDGRTFYFLQVRTTNSSGLAVFTHPLLLSDLNWTYAMVEAVPPLGYTVLDEPTTFALNGSDQQVTGITPLDSGNPLLIADGSEGGPRLPDTGGPGNAEFYWIGLLLLTTSGLAVLAPRRRDGLMV